MRYVWNRLVLWVLDCWFGRPARPWPQQLICGEFGRWENDRDRLAYDPLAPQRLESVEDPDDGGGAAILPTPAAARDARRRRWRLVSIAAARQYALEMTRTRLWSRRGRVTLDGISLRYARIKILPAEGPRPELRILEILYDDRREERFEFNASGALEWHVEPLPG